MELPPLTDAFILKRYKRFLADVELADGSVVTAHCPNTGKMTGCWQPGARAQLSHSNDPRRKLPWTLERVDMGAGWIGVNTHRVNGVVDEAIAQGRIEQLSGYRQQKREVTVVRGAEKSRLDLVLGEGPQADAYLEIKNVTLLLDSCLAFPDAVSERARKHLKLLTLLAAEGKRAVMVFAMNRPEGTCFSPADSVDPEYGAALRKAQLAGVEILALRMEHTPTGIVVSGVEPVKL